jgi:HlyD family secretion protein
MNPPAASISRDPTRTRAGASSWWRRAPVIAGVVFTVLVVVGLWPRPLPVEISTVGRGNVVVTVDEEGMTRVKNRYVISAPVTGQLRRIDWKAGTNVEAGKTPLATLETMQSSFLDARGQAEAEARVRAAEANLQAAVAQKQRASAAAKMYAADFERVTQLFERKVSSRQELDGAEMRSATAQQEERAAEFSMHVAEFELEQARAIATRDERGANATGGSLVVKSPVNGCVLRVYQESERVVIAGTPLIEVGDVTDLEARIEVLSRDGVAVQPGARVTFEQWGGPAPLTGRVRVVEPSAFTKISALGVEEQRVYVVVDFVDPVERRPTLGDNYRVEGRIVVWEGANVLRVPSGALFQRGAGWQVFVVDGGRAKLRNVQVGHSNGFETEITDGLREGEHVVVYPGDKVADDVRVRPIRVAE